MSYADLCDHLDALEGDGRRHVVALPDGSVDHRYALSGAGGVRVERADEFRSQLAAGSRAFSLEPVDVRPGGQAVNAARQVHALGDSATLVGHLDHPVLAEFPFETRSMGPPATVRVVMLDEDDLLFSEPGAAETWELADLRAVVDWDRILDADALCCANWVSVRGLTAVFDRFRSAPPDESLTIVLDPGPIDAVDPSALEDLFDVLSRTDGASESIEIVLSVNPTELEAAVAATDVSGRASDRVSDASGVTSDGTRDRNRALGRAVALRSAIGISGVISHGTAVAAGATRNGTTVVNMLEVGETKHTTGAGDRFSAGVACALAREWSLETALALGNACAAHFVGTGETAGPAAVRSILERSERDR
ncbi:PfkB family carbohydrate kinase [Natrinema halophilum]|uniref:Carbohydrate kinase family protein n=1 Tax=Natrinema halophilum TaxID=1699371 RepID=A0A7D5KER7_9EURY|nr:PfkB family carbohydrate kinase [Natrinema halophilum]QLG50456.1 PfkB family carbohydrate kinase [Natrinema halophilum]